MGVKGSGKTKAFIENVNSAVHKEHGHVVCITKGSRHMFDLNHKVRMVDSSEVSIKNHDVFYGFLAGILSGNFDITHVFIDSVTKIVDCENSLRGFDDIIPSVKELSDHFSVAFTVTISADISDVPPNIKEYLVEY